jgi:hypothetical protein
VVSAQAVDTQRAGLKRQVRDIANGARSFATGLRRRMNALDARAVSPDDAEGPADAHGAAIGEAVDSTTRAQDGPADPPPSAGRDVEPLPAPAAVAAVAE